MTRARGPTSHQPFAAPGGRQGLLSGAGLEAQQISRSSPLPAARSSNLMPIAPAAGQARRGDDEPFAGAEPQCVIRPVSVWLQGSSPGSVEDVPAESHPH